MYVVWNHSAAYRVYKGTLWFYPVYDNGSIHYQRGQLLIESPETFRTGHRLALIQLGITERQRQERILRKITYYRGRARR